MDVHNKNTRSFNMSRIKGKNTKPEILVRKFLFHNGLRYRKNVKELPGKPDIVISKYNTIIFVNGCFWHAHENCELFKWPKSRSEKWRKKLEGNRKRDRKNIKKLEDNGWKVIVIWECQLKSKDYINKLYGLIDNIKTISK